MLTWPSPYCPHCVDFAPTFQTLYEFYYTSTPAGNAPKDADFTSFYDFRFADLNCVAYHDLCAQHKVSSWPSTILYEDGEPIVSFRGVKSISVLSAAVEDALEKVKPGTRPAKLDLPEPGDKSSPDAKGNSRPDKASPPAKEQKKDEKAKEADADRPAITSDAPVAPVATTSDTPAETSTSIQKYLIVPFDPPVPEVAKPKSTPNPNGISVPLTAESFQNLVTLTQEPWFVKFYAPWCQHCRTIAPIWEQLAKVMKGRLNIGEVNCDAESRLCKDARLRGYPTFLFFRGGERVEYNGLRGLGDFVQYAEKAVDLANGIQDVDADSFKELEEKEDVIFLYFYDHATTSEDFLALERLTMSLLGRAKLVRTRDPRLYDRFKITTWPRLLVSREGRPTYYTPLTPREMRDTRLLLDWMKSVWLPLVPELNSANAREIMDGKIVVLGILNRENEESFQSAIREMKSAANEWMDKQIQLFQLERQELRDAKQLRIEEAEDRGDERALRNAKNIRIDMNRSGRKEVTFAWVDGAFWQRWIRTTYGIDIKDGDRVIINDEDVSAVQTLSLSPPHTRRRRWTRLTNATEPSVLGPDQHRQPDCAVAHVDPRDHQQGHGEPAQDQAEVHHLFLREDHLRHQGHVHGAPVPQLGLRARHRLWLRVVVPGQVTRATRPLQGRRGRRRPVQGADIGGHVGQRQQGGLESIEQEASRAGSAGSFPFVYNGLSQLGSSVFCSFFFGIRRRRFLGASEGGIGLRCCILIRVHGLGGVCCVWFSRPCWYIVDLEFSGLQDACG